jgi:DNA mismatch repair protein MutS
MISLLHPSGAPPARPADAWAADLAIEPIVRALALNGRYQGAVRAVLVGLCTDAATIAFRQDLLDDLLARPALDAALEELLPALATAAAAGTSRWAGEAGIFQVAGRLGELEALIAAVRGLLAALDAATPPLAAAGWLALRDELRRMAADAEFQALERELPALRAELERAGSVTLGINLDAQLRPEGATLLSVNAERFGGPRSLLGRLLGPERDRRAGLSPLRTAGDRQPFGPDRQLFLDLSELLEEVTAPVAAALTRFARTSGAALAHLENELAFFVGAARLVRALRAEGYALARPAIAPPDARLLVADGLYSLDLALRLRARPPANGVPPAPVPNSAAFDDAGGRIAILTGPNRGGKTTYTRAIGQALVLAQAGLPVPARSAQISPADAIFALFPAAEQAQTGKGRLDEEAEALAALFRQATRRSLVLLNEPLGSTSPHEALAIARDVLCGLRMLGARAILVTHLHELAREAAALNAAVEGDSAVVSLVAGASEGDDGDAVRTFRVAPGLPGGRSYAADIAVAHGLHLSQIQRTLRERDAVQARQPEI